MIQFIEVLSLYLSFLSLQKYHTLRSWNCKSKCGRQPWKRNLVRRPSSATPLSVLKLSHLDARGDARMVDVSAKAVTLRMAVARGEIRMGRATLRLLKSNQLAKGNVLATARIAGIQAAKRTGELIPLCHPLPLSHCEVDFEVPRTADRIVITATSKIAAQTGVEMEALTAVSVAALTIYDMCKAVDKGMRIADVKLVSKTKQSL